MKRYESITKFLPEFAAKDFGKMAENPMIGAVYNYSGWVEELSGAVFTLIEHYPLADLHNYFSYLPDEETRPEDYTEVEAMATLVQIYRAERFCDGAILTAMESGLAEACVRALARADENGAAGVKTRLNRLFGREK